MADILTGRIAGHSVTHYVECKSYLPYGSHGTQSSQCINTFTTTHPISISGLQNIKVFWMWTWFIVGCPKVPMDNFYRHSLSRQDLNVRAAHSLCRAGWMLTEINGVLQNGSIKPASFALIQQQATTLDQLQRKFGPPPKLSSTINTQTIKIHTPKTLTIRVMNRDVEAAAAVLTHHGWHYSQINDVLKPAITSLDNLGSTLITEQPSTAQTMYHYPLHPRPRTARYHHPHSVGKTLFALFWFGGLIFVGVSLMLHML